MGVRVKIIRVELSLVKPIIIEKHYLHRMPTGVYKTFALIQENKIVGVAVFSKSYNTSMITGIAGKTYKSKVLEFSRMWVCDTMPKNTESMFISRCLKLLPNKIIVSFADPSVGHIGTIYQATNWMYFGCGKDREFIVPKSHNGHPLSVMYGRTQKELLSNYSKDQLKTMVLSGKHKYIISTLNKKEHKLFMQRLKKKPRPYPKVNV